MAGVPQGVQMEDSAAGEADKMRESPTCNWIRENTGCDRAVPLLFGLKAVRMEKREG